MSFSSENLGHENEQDCEPATTDAEEQVIKRNCKRLFFDHERDLMYICEGLQEESSAAPPPQVNLRFSHLLRQVGAVLFNGGTKCIF